MIYIIIFAYLFVGTIIATAMEINGNISIIPLLFWPMVLMGLCIFGVLHVAVMIAGDYT